MERLIIDIDSVSKARELRSVLEDLGFVKHITLIHDLDESAGPSFESDADFLAELERRNSALESGAVKGLSMDELAAGAAAFRRNRA